MGKRRQNADWHCVHFLDQDSLELFEGKLENCLKLRCDASGVGSEEDLFDLLAVSLKFPDYFGNNWDALDECLVDMEWMPSSGYLLVVSGARQLWSKAPSLAGKLVSAWLAAATTWASEDVPFHLVFTAPS